MKVNGLGAYLIKKVKSPKIPQPEAEQIVFNLVRTEINDNQFSALVSFVMSEGEYKLRRSILLKTLNGGNILQAGLYFPKYTTRNGKIRKALILLRKAEQRLFLMPVIVKTDKGGGNGISA